MAFTFQVDRAALEAAHADRIEQLAERARPHLKRGHEARTLEWVALVDRHFRTDRDVVVALCVISYESGGNPAADNPGSSAGGLWQHLGKYWPTRSVKAGVPGTSRYDPVAATVVAAWLRYDAGGWSHWTVWRNNCRGVVR